MSSIRTSQITFLSTDHGRMRREQRDIDKRDIQKAIKYGTRTSCWNGRWKIEYDGIIFITDASCRREVTAYPSPLSFAETPFEVTEEHSKAKLVLSRKPDLCASHTVLVVDNSGSMTTHDILYHRDRQTAAYSVTALELVAEQLFNGTANNSDVVSLIEFSNTARVVFEREPVSWVLYNKLLTRRDRRTFAARKEAEHSDILGCDSNYLPALVAAKKLLALDVHETCALSLFFIYDGAPSDARNLGLTPAAALRTMTNRVNDLAVCFEDKLTMTMVGFGNARCDFSSLEAMATAFNAASGDNHRAQFMYCNKMADGISSAISSMVSTTTMTRLTLSRREKEKGRTKRNVASEVETNNFNDWKFYGIVGHFVYDPSVDDFVRHPGLPPGALRTSNKVQALKRQRELPPLLAFNTSHCGEGAERLAYRCQLSTQRSTAGFVLGNMVAKETNLVERIEEHIAFHKGFCKTQSLAAHLADEFNRRLQGLSSSDANRAPRVSFLACSVLVLVDPSWPNGERGMLVEKMLDRDRHGWQKWNDNNGAVDGKAAHVPLDLDFELAKLDREVTIIEEGSSDEETDSEDDDHVQEADPETTFTAKLMGALLQIISKRLLISRIDSQTGKYWFVTSRVCSTLMSYHQPLS